MVADIGMRALDLWNNARSIARVKRKSLHYVMKRDIYFVQLALWWPPEMNHLIVHQEKEAFSCYDV
jgi:hypothetical protein